MTSTAPRLVLVGGHESGDAVDLVRYERLLPHAVATRPGRRLHDVVSSAVADPTAGEAVVVVPMTYGRDPAMVADAAKTLRWIAAKHPGSVVLAAPFGVPDHLTARLRAVAGGVRAADAHAALVIVARTSNPFDDAELHRIGHLVRVHGAGAEVVIATLDADAAVAPVLHRLRLLGFERSVVAPAGFSRGLDVNLDDPSCAGMTQHGPLMSDSAVVRIVTERVEVARHDLHHGRDGIDAGLGADHGHGYAHSHGLAQDRRHSHEPAHSH